MGFTKIFLNVLVMLVYMMFGFLLTKAGKAESEQAKSISGFLIYVCCPCMIFSSFFSMEKSDENIRQAGLFFVFCFLLLLLFFGILWLIFRKKYEDGRYRILTASALMGNVGFFGLPLVVSLFPDQPIVACYSTMYVTAMNIFVFTVGVWLITKDRKYISLKAAIFNPTVLSALVAIPIFLLQPKIPALVTDSVSLLGKMTTPLCMLILGMRLASMKFREIFSQPFVYFACAMKLIVFPLFAFLCVRWFPGLDETFRVTVCVLSAAPSASVLLSLAELHGCEQKLSANVLLLTTLFSLITMPLLMLLFA